MNKLLGVDYGRQKIGLAFGDTDSRLAEPLNVIRYENEGKLMEKLLQILQELDAGKTVVGVSEGKMAKETRNFGKKLERKSGIPVIFQDETLTSKDAQKLARESGMKRKKRREMEDAYSATLILQGYLDNL